MRSQYRYGTVKREFFCMCGFEHGADAGMKTGYCEDQVDVFVFYELFNGIIKIIHANEIKFRVVFTKNGKQFTPFSLVFLCKRHIVLVAYIDNMQFCL